jgi:hypothetical protein
LIFIASSSPLFWSTHFDEMGGGLTGRMGKHFKAIGKRTDADAGGLGSDLDLGCPDGRIALTGGASPLIAISA